MKSQQNTVTVQKVLVQVALVVLSIAFLFPFAWMILTALKPLDETMKIPIKVHVEQLHRRD